MKAIETQYKGYRFRSRLEARWAVFFDALGLSWEYEPEGFELPDGTRYLPDFRVTSPQGVIYWYEVKPDGVDSDEKFTKFLGAINGEDEGECVYGFLLSGDPMSFLESCTKNGGVCPRCGKVSREFEYGTYEHGASEVGIGCEPCDFNTPGGGDNDEEPGVTVPSTPHKGMLLVSSDDFIRHTKIVMAAASLARSARFEFGESGAKRG